MRTLQDTNTTLAKCQRTKKTHLPKKIHLIKKILRFYWQKKKKRNIQCFLMVKMLVHQKRIK